MRSRSAPGSSTPTSRPIRPHQLRVVLLAAVLTPLIAVYVIESFIAPVPLLRIAMRSFPVLPVAVWTLWFDSARPLEKRPPALRTAGRIGLLLVTMVFAVLILGIGLNWLYDPNRVIG